MIHFKRGNIFNCDCEAVVNPVNTVGVMGKGLALQFKRAYPEMYMDYLCACNTRDLMIGKVHVWKVNDGLEFSYIINFPTKNDWRNPSKLSYIEGGMIDLCRVIKKHNIHSIAIPALGCGLGGLDWIEVKNLMFNILTEMLDDSHYILIYEPN